MDVTHEISQKNIASTKNFIDENLDQIKDEIAAQLIPIDTKNIECKSKIGDNSEHTIRIGNDFQAICPQLIPNAERELEDLHERALLVWSPSEQLSDAELQAYITLTRERYNYNIEQALAMLLWHKYDVERAAADLRHFTPCPEEWTPEDKKLFEEALLFHGKNFHRIQELLPDKTVGGVINHYYAWKRRGRRRIIDRQVKNRSDKEASERQKMANL